MTPSLAAHLARLVSPNGDAAIRTAPGAHHWRLFALEVRGASGAGATSSGWVTGRTSSGRSAMSRTTGRGHHGNVIAGGPSSQYPSGNQFPSVLQFYSQFVSAASDNYELVPSSGYAKAATDGTAVGANAGVIWSVMSVALNGIGDTGRPRPPGSQPAGTARPRIGGKGAARPVRLDGGGHEAPETVSRVTPVAQPAGSAVSRVGPR